MSLAVCLLALCTGPASPADAAERVTSKAIAPGCVLSDGYVHVVLDRSHEWAFAHDDIAHKILPPHGFQVVLCEASLNTTAKLELFDILVVPQCGSSFRFSDLEVSGVKDFVSAGGRLIIVGRPDRPIAELAKSFGFTMTKAETHPPFTCTQLLQGFGAQSTLVMRGSIPFTLTCSSPCNALVEDSRGSTIAAVRSFDDGKVILFCDDGTYWDFCSQRDKDENVPNTGNTAAFFELLVDGRQPNRSAPRVGGIVGELGGEYGGLKVRYSNPLAKAAAPIVALLPKVCQEVTKANGVSPTGVNFVANLLATGAGGWSSGIEVGIPAEGSPGDCVAIMAHELTHNCLGNAPGILCEGWASLTGMRTASSLGYPEVEKKEMANRMESWRKEDPTGRQLGLGNNEPNDSLSEQRRNKLIWMITELQKTYGRDYMVRFVELRNALMPDRIGVEDMLYLFSLTAGKDLSDWYRSLGVSYTKPSASFTPEQVNERLEAYRSRSDRKPDAAPR